MNDMTFAIPCGEFINSDRRCPDDAKLLVVEADAAGDRVHRCLHCGHSELELLLPYDVKGAVAAIVAQREAVHEVKPCAACGEPVVEAKSIHGKFCPLNPTPVPGGTFRLFARKGMAPLASWTPVGKRWRTVALYSAHIPTCGKAVAS